MEFAAEGPKAIPLWVNGHAFLTVTDAFYDVVNPVSGEAVYRVPLCGAAEAAEAVAAARRAQSGWAAGSADARQACLNALADRLEGYAGHFAKLLRGDTGFAELFFDEVRVPVENCLAGEGQGWNVAMATAGFERGLMLRSPGRFQATAKRLVELYRAHEAEASPAAGEAPDLMPTTRTDFRPASVARLTVRRPSRCGRLLFARQ